MYSHHMLKATTRVSYHICVYWRVNLPHIWTIYICFK